MNLGARVVGSIHIATLFGAIAVFSMKMEAVMTLNMTCGLMVGAALLRRSGDGSEIRRDGIGKAYNS